MRPNQPYRFFRYCLGHLDNRKTKIAERSAIHFFWKLTPKQVFVESLTFDFDSPSTKWQSFNFFAKLNGNHIFMANFPKLCKYQTFDLIKLHNLSKVKLADRIFKLWKAVYTITGSSNIHSLKFDIFPTFKRLLPKFLRKTSRFQNRFWKYWQSFTASPIFMIWNFSTMKQQPFEFSLHGRAFCFLNFVKWGNY